ncbi:hypothetical protein NC652_011266 [Populus alba x Populus x berolinensis]|nr:hypothetical protein NC652_011266 [Populus alba x Populus x berolinensis]
MERSGFGSSMTVAVAVAVLVFAMMVMVPEVSATRWTVGSNMGWTTNVNYTIWAQDKHFYNGDWLCNYKYSFLHESSFRSCLCVVNWVSLLSVCMLLLF